MSRRRTTVAANILVSGLAIGMLAGCRAAGPPASDAALAPSLAALRDYVAAAERAGTSVVEGRDDWLFFTPELRHLTRGPFWGAAAQAAVPARASEADPLPAILDFHTQLAARGVELLVVPVPPKVVVYPDKLLPSVPLDPRGRPRRLDPHLQAFYAILRREGVQVLDLTDLFLDLRAAAAEPLYCRHDTHWSGRGIVLAAEAIARYARERPWVRRVALRALTTRWRSLEIEGDLWQLLNQPARPREVVTLRFVGTPQADGLAPVAPDPTSALVLLGDSHALVFHVGDDLHARGAGLADQLAAELGLPVDLVAVRGSGATAARVNLLRRAQRDPNYWAGKKLVVWCFGAREFTEGDGWKKLPVAVAPPS